MLDNYISESVSEGVSVGDIYVEQALAQLNVAYSLVASYAKDVAYVEYMAEMNGVDIYQEGFFEEMEIDENMSDDSFDGQDKSLNWKGKLRKFGKTMLSGPGKFWSLIKAAASAVATALTNLWRFITEKNLSKCIEKLEADESGKKYAVPVRLSKNVAGLISACDNFAKVADDYANSIGKNVSIEPPEVLKSYRGSNETREETPKELAQTLRAFNKGDFANSLKADIKKLKNAISECDKRMKEKDKENYKWAKKNMKGDNDLRNRDLKQFKEVAESLTNFTTMTLRDLRTVSNKVLKTMKSDSKSKGSSDDTSDDEE